MGTLTGFFWRTQTLISGAADVVAGAVVAVATAAPDVVPALVSTLVPEQYAPAALALLAYVGGRLSGYNTAPRDDEGAGRLSRLP